MVVLKLARRNSSLPANESRRRSTFPSPFANSVFILIGGREGVFETIVNRLRSEDFTRVNDSCATFLPIRELFKRKTIRANDNSLYRHFPLSPRCNYRLPCRDYRLLSLLITALSPLRPVISSRRRKLASSSKRGNFLSLLPY